MDERRTRRETDEKVDELYIALLGNFERKGALRELSEGQGRIANDLLTLTRRVDDHEADQRKRDERTDERGKEVRGVLLNVVERSVIALIGAVGGAWVAIQAFVSGKSQQP